MGFSNFGSWALEHGSLVVVCGFSGFEACGIFPDKEWNHCPLL